MTGPGACAFCDQAAVTEVLLTSPRGRAVEPVCLECAVLVDASRMPSEGVEGLLDGRSGVWA